MEKTHRKVMVALPAALVDAADALVDCEVPEQDQRTGGRTLRGLRDRSAALAYLATSGARSALEEVSRRIAEDDRERGGWVVVRRFFTHDPGVEAMTPRSAPPGNEAVTAILRQWGDDGEEPCLPRSQVDLSMHVLDVGLARLRRAHDVLSDLVAPSPGASEAVLGGT